MKTTGKLTVKFVVPVFGNVIQLNGRLIAEKDSLRKMLQDAQDNAITKGKEQTLLRDDNLALEKRIQQLQVAEESSGHVKSALDYELAKIKVSRATVLPLEEQNNNFLFTSTGRKLRTR